MSGKTSSGPPSSSLLGQRGREALLLGAGGRGHRVQDAAGLQLHELRGKEERDAADKRAPLPRLPRRGDDGLWRQRRKDPGVRGNTGRCRVAGSFGSLWLFRTRLDIFVPRRKSLGTGGLAVLRVGFEVVGDHFCRYEVWKLCVPLRVFRLFRSSPPIRNHPSRVHHGGISGTVAGNGRRDGRRVELWRTRKHEAARGSMPALQAHSREQARMNLCVEEL